MKKFMLLSFSIIFFGCIAFDPAKQNLEIHNFSDEAIYVYYTYYNEIQITPKLELFLYLPDRAPDESDLDSFCSPQYRVNAHTSSIIETGYSTNSKWIPFTNKDYVNFFFIKESTMRSNTWEKICKKQLYEKKVKYSYKELEKLHYRILYRP